MKLEDLSIFVEVARATGLRSAAKHLNMQPGTLSKTIKRIEAHYQQTLFERQGMQWILTSSGEMLFHRAIEMLSINEKIERELGKPRRPHLRISGSEALLSSFVPRLMTKFSDKQQEVTLETTLCEDLTMLAKHDVDLAVVSSLHGQQPYERQIDATPLQDINFVTVASPTHPLAIAGNVKISIEQTLAYPFAVPSKSIYGKMAMHRSHDGWHDEHYNRLISVRADTTSTLISMVKSQPLLAYLPDYIAQEHQLHIIDVLGCPYTCEQTVWLCKHKYITPHWMPVFD